MADWIEYQTEWAYYIDPETFDMPKVRGRGCRQLPQTWTILDIFEYDLIYSSRETSS